MPYKYDPTEPWPATYAQALIEFEFPETDPAEADSDEAIPSGTKCAWWALCPNLATTTEPHLILGAVPICAKCAELVAKLSHTDCPIHGANCEAWS